MKTNLRNVVLLALIALLQLVVSEQALALTKPTLLSPGDNAQITSSSVTFSWSHPYNDLYEVKIKTSGGTLKYASGKISSKSKTVNLSGIPLTYGSTYKWYVVVYAIGQEDSSVDRWFTYKYQNQPLPGGVSVNPASGTWTTSPRNLSISSTGATTFYYRMVNTYDGSTPSDPAAPSPSSNDGSSSPTFQLSAATGQLKRIKLRFVGCNSAGCGPVSGVYSYTLDLRTAPPPSADDHGNTCSTATAVEVNSSRAGTIGSPGDWDYFRIQVPSSGSLTLSTTGSTDTYGFLKNSACADIESDDDDGDGTNFRIVRPLTAGTYYVAVRHYSSSGTGSYTLNVSFAATPPPTADDHGNNCSTATAVDVNSSRPGTIASAGDWDYFRVQVPSSGRTLTVYTQGSTDTKGLLKNSACTDINGLTGHPDDYGGDQNFLLSGPVMAGTYYVAVRHYSSSGTGSYRLYVDWGIDVSRMTPIADYSGHLGADYSPLNPGTAVLYPVTGRVIDVGVHTCYGTMAVAVEVTLSSSRTFSTEWPNYTLSTNKAVLIFGHLRPSRDLRSGDANQRFQQGEAELNYRAGDIIKRGTRLGYVEQHPYEFDNGSNCYSTNSHVHVTGSDGANPPTNIWAGTMPNSALERKKYIKPELAWPNLQR